MTSLFDLMTPAPTGISGVKEIVSRIDKMKFGSDTLQHRRITPPQAPSPKIDLQPLPDLVSESPTSPMTTLGDYTCDSDESSGECSSQDDNTSTDELPEMLDDIPKDTKKPKQPKQPRAKNKAHDISKLFYHLSKAFEIIGDLNNFNERDT